MSRIFISYKRQDKDIVLPIVEEIKQKTGVDCWIDLNGIESGDQFQNVIIDAIDNADIVIFMLSKNFIAPYRDEIIGEIDLKKQTFPEKEVMYALRHNKRLIPVSIDGTTVYDCKWLEFNCSGLDCVNWSNNELKIKLINSLIALEKESVGKSTEPNLFTSSSKRCSPFPKKVLKYMVDTFWWSLKHFVSFLLIFDLALTILWGISYTHNSSGHWIRIVDYSISLFPLLATIALCRFYIAYMNYKRRYNTIYISLGIFLLCLILYIAGSKFRSTTQMITYPLLFLCGPYNLNHTQIWEFYSSMTCSPFAKGIILLLPYIITLLNSLIVSFSLPKEKSNSKAYLLVISPKKDMYPPVLIFLILIFACHLGIDLGFMGNDFSLTLLCYYCWLFVLKHNYKNLSIHDFLLVTFLWVLLLLFRYVGVIGGFIGLSIFISWRLYKKGVPVLMCIFTFFSISIFLPCSNAGYNIFTCNESCVLRYQPVNRGVWLTQTIQFPHRWGIRDRYGYIMEPIYDHVDIADYNYFGYEKLYVVKKDNLCGLYDIDLGHETIPVICSTINQKNSDTFELFHRQTKELSKYKSPCYYYSISEKDLVRNFDDLYKFSDGYISNTFYERNQLIGY